MNRNDRAITAFAMVGHAMFHTYELVIPIFVAIWLDTFSTTAASLGIVVGLSYAFTGIGALPSGILADRVSAKRLILLSLIGMGISFAIISVSPNLPVLTGGLLLWGAAASIYHPAGLSLISRGTKQRGTAFAYHGAAGNVGVAIGPLGAAILLAFFGWRIVAAVLVVPVAIALLAVARMEFDETAGSEARSAERAGDGSGAIRSVGEFLETTKLLFAGGFVFVFLVGILYGLYYRGALTFLPDLLADVPTFAPVDLYGRRFEPSQYVYAGLLLLGGAGQYTGGRVADAVRPEKALVGIYATLLVLALLFIPSLGSRLFVLLSVAGLLGFSVFAAAPINQVVISKYTGASVRGLSFGYVYVGTLGVGASGAALAGVVLTYASPMALFVVLGGFATAAASLGVYLLVRAGRGDDGAG
jgi:MFS family permease